MKEEVVYCKAFPLAEYERPSGALNWINTRPELESKVDNWEIQ